MKNFPQKKLFWTKLAAVIFLSLSFALNPLAAPKASAWETFISVPIGVALDNVIQTVKGVILGSLKQQAAKALNREISLMVGGSSAKNAKFIVDWKGYLVDQPQKNTALYINARIDQAIAGRGTRSQYIPAGSEGFGLSIANFNNQLKAGVIASVINPGTPKVTYVGNPSQMFAQGNFRNLSLYLSGINNPWAFNLHFQEQYDKKIEEEKMIAANKSTANQGFVGTESNGKTITPGVLIKEQMAGVQNMGYQIVASATNIPEVITAVISQMVIKSVQQGIGNVQANINKEIVNAQNQEANQQNSAIQKLGPGAQYAPSWSQGASSSTICNVQCNGGAHFAASCTSTEIGTAACPLVSGKQYCCIPTP